MGCGGSRVRERKLVQITTARKPKSITVGKVESQPKSRPVNDTKPRLVPAVETFHCGECLLTLDNRTTDYYHRCKGYDPATANDPRREYQRQRQAKCDACQHNVDGVCMIEKGVHPDRPCVIEIGIRKHQARCRLGEWDDIK